VIRSLGVQTTTRMRFPLATHSRFIPASQIDDVFIYEGLKGFQVWHYLAVVVYGEEQLEVVFLVPPPYQGHADWEKLLPRREVLEHVWRSMREVLFKVDGQQLPNGKAD
jgi:GPI-GlcNAc transferase complex, PIG-H component